MSCERRKEREKAHDGSHGPFLAGGPVARVRGLGVPVEREGDRVVLRGVDDGVGVNEDELARLFERFYSLRPRHEPFGMHSGLGLSISRQIIEAHSPE